MEDNASAPVQAWLQGQTAHAEDYFQSQLARPVLREEFRRLYALDTVGMPYPFKGRHFMTKRRAGEDLHVLYVQDGLDGEPRVLIDQNALSTDKSVTLASWAPTEDGRLMAYGLSISGNDKHDLRIKDVATVADLPDVIPDGNYPVFKCWNVDGTGFWYAKHDSREPLAEAKLHKRLYFHALGTPWQTDPIVFGEGFDKEALFGARSSLDGRYLLVSVLGNDKASGLGWSELYLRDLSDPVGPFVCIYARKLDMEVSGEIHRDRVYLLAQDGAPNKRILAMDVEKALAGCQDWDVVVPEGAGVIRDMLFVGGHLFIETLEDVHSVLRQYDLEGRLVREVPLPTIGSLGGLACESEGEELFFSFNSFALPPTVYRLDLRTNDLRVFAQADAGFDTSLIVTKQVWYSSKDGTKIPMFLIHRQGLLLDGANPTVLYGYGGFDISLTPSFDKSIVPFVRRGGVYAIANLRGGGEFGQAWHQAGMQKSKQNVFDDFAAAARWLIGSGYTCTERLAIEGGSNGGLLTLATITQNPGLVAAAIADVPVADMLRYHRFFGGVYWIPDYGDPDEPSMREYLLKYSPYHNVVDGTCYPAVLIATADGDDRVHPMHSYKMAARLLEANASNQPILLRVELKAGHGGASAISKHVESAADHWSFLFDQLGMTA
jgi:prolyl oligopeptidase